MKFFLDVDNTILEHSGFYSIETESRIHSSIGKFPSENENAIKIMYESAICRNPDIVKELFKLENVYILTKYPAIEYEVHKQRRIAEILGISHDDLINMKDKNGINKYLFIDNDHSKVQTVKELFKFDTLENCVLLDDYSANLIEWENNGGIAIKYYNEYNNPYHPIKGLSVSNFKIFYPMLHGCPISDLLVSCEDSYLLNLFVKLLHEKTAADNIDIIQIIYDDLIKKLDIEKMDINSKYNIRNFLLEYYALMNSLKPNYWSDILKEKMNDETKASLVCASFDTDLKKLKIFKDENNLAIKIMERKDGKTTNIYDVYLTLDENAFLDNIDLTLNRLFGILSMFLFKEVE